jgi:hypothetical protein
LLGDCLVVAVFASESLSSRIATAPSTRVTGSPHVTEI